GDELVVDPALMLDPLPLSLDARIARVALLLAPDLLLDPEGRVARPPVEPRAHGPLFERDLGARRHAALRLPEELPLDPLAAGVLILRTDPGRGIRRELVAAVQGPGAELVREPEACLPRSNHGGR